MSEYGKREWIKIIHECIMDELADGAYYRKLAPKASEYEAKDMLLSMAADEERHAKELMKFHDRVCGCPKYKNPVTPQPAVGDYKEALEVRFHEEIGAAKRYKHYYLSCGNDRLRELWFDLMHDEDRHAKCVLYLMNKYCLKKDKDHKPCSAYEGLDYGYSSPYSQFEATNYPLSNE